MLAAVPINGTCTIADTQWKKFIYTSKSAHPEGRKLYSKWQLMHASFFYIVLPTYSTQADERRENMKNKQTNKHRRLL